MSQELVKNYLLKDKFRTALWVYFLIGIFILFLYSRFLVPFGFAIAGHDSGLPIDARRFLETRLFAWDERIGFGIDNSHLFGSLITHFVDYLSSLVVGVSYAGNWFNLFFWLSAIFVAAIIFSYQFKDVLGRYFVFVLPPLVIFNFYLFQSVFILERAKYSVLVSILLFLAIVYKFQEGKISLWKGAILSSFVFFFFNSGSLLGLPLYGSLLVMVGVLIIFNFIEAVVRRDLSNLTRLIIFLVLTACGSLLLNSYQILPYVPSIIGKSYVLHLSSKVLVKSKDWVDYISQNASLLNIFRLQGIPTWYSEIQVTDPEHAYAPVYLGNKFLVFISFLFPILSFLGLTLVKDQRQKKLILFFAFLYLVSMPFVAGTHSPFGALYGFLYDYFPGFSIFRTPYYKFSGAYFLSAAFLIAATFAILIERSSGFLHDKFHPKSIFNFAIGPLLTVIVVVLWLSYHFVLFAPDKVFSWRRNISTKIKIPNYIEVAREYLNGISLEEGRVLFLPPIEEVGFSDGYMWGYWSLSPLTFSLTSAPVLSNEVLVTDEERGWTDLLYTALKEKNNEEFLDLSSRLDVGFLLLRSDFSELADSTDYKEILLGFSGISKVKSLGEWVVFRIDKRDDALFSLVTRGISLPQGHDYLSRSFVKQLGVSMSSNHKYEPELENLLEKEIQVHNCESCVLEKRPGLTSLPKVTILPNSALYLFKEIRDKNVLGKAKGNQQLIDSYLGTSLRRLAEIKTMLDLDLPDNDVLKALKATNFYLDELLTITQGSVKPAKYFTYARRIHDILYLPQQELVTYVQNQKFFERNELVREEILAALWRIDKVKSYSSPLLENLDIWETQKFYSVEIPKSGNYGLYIQLSSFSQAEDGQFILPKAVEFTKDGEKKEVELESVEGDWLRLDVNFQTEGVADLILYFDETPNLYKYEDNSSRRFYDRNRACVVGKVNNIKNFKNYVIKINPGQNVSDLRLILRDPDRLYSKRHGFARGEEEIDIPGNNPFRHIYDLPAKNLEVLICGKEETVFPNISEVSIQEIFEPNVITVLEKEQISLSTPEVTYIKINPTEYLVNISDVKNPFILVFNTRFSPLWRLERQRSQHKGLSSKLYNFIQTILGKDLEGDNHFLIDGYANGWFIDEEEDTTLVIEYTPQKLFYVGTAITAVSFLLTGTISFYLFLKRKKFFRKIRE